jgi:hypothetical protein
MTVAGVVLAVTVFHGFRGPLWSRRVTAPDAAEDAAFAA